MCLQFYAHHGKVVVGFCPVAVTCYFLSQCFNDLPDRTGLRLAKDVQQPVVAELFLFRILGFVQSVGV